MCLNALLITWRVQLTLAFLVHIITLRMASNTDASGPKKPPFFAETVSVTTEGSIAAESASVNKAVDN